MRFVDEAQLLDFEYANWPVGGGGGRGGGAEEEELFIRIADRYPITINRLVITFPVFPNTLDLIGIPPAGQPSFFQISSIVINRCK